MIRSQGQRTYNWEDYLRTMFHPFFTIFDRGGSICTCERRVLLQKKSLNGIEHTIAQFITFFLYLDVVTAAFVPLLMIDEC